MEREHDIGREIVEAEFGIPDVDENQRAELLRRWHQDEETGEEERSKRDDASSDRA